MQAQGRQACADAFVALVAERPQLQFVLRPHPNENREFYRSLLATHDLGNVRFCPQDYIWNVLNASDLHLHRHCTTAIEAWMWDKPTIEMGMDPMSKLPWPEREAGSDMARTANDLIAIADHYLSGASVNGTIRSYRRDYVHQWFGPADGERCRSAAQSIDSMLQAFGRRRSMSEPYAGVSAPARQVGAAVVRYALSRKPNQPLRRRISAAAVDPRDKQITRKDVRAYSRLIAPAFA